jgi:hypothetical protein
LLRLLSIYSGILPIFFFFLYLNRNKKEGLWVIFLYVMVSFLTDFSFEIFKFKINPELSFIIFSLFTVLEYTFFTTFIYLNFKKQLFRNILVYSSILFYTFCILSFYYTDGYTFDSLPASIESILVIVFCILFFFEQINTPETSFIYSTKKFWIVTAFLIYLSGTLFLFVYASNITENEQNLYWPINYVFNILKNIIITLAFLLPTSGSQNFFNDDFFGKPPVSHYKS